MEAILWFLIIGVLFYFMMKKGGCGMHGGGHGGHGGGHMGHGSGEELPTESVRDPLCGMTVKIEKAQSSAEHMGQTYYFCSAPCHDKFLKEPMKYMEAEQQRGSSHRGCC
ncbi:MAG: YHS domain-containing protein [Deltaproteobacteria bacterium]|nr:YHS domain-containing protein [Deltaproteobacteria bacterium]MBW2307636.1 YHS domain-containing protein [Deltaproteobacteria bacterium]